VDRAADVAQRKDNIMKYVNSDDYNDLMRGPETDAERMEADNAWRILRHLTACAGPGAEVYGTSVTTRNNAFQANYWANEMGSAYDEFGYGSDPIAAMRNMHECAGHDCTHDLHDVAAFEAYNGPPPA
jgi:hypothetical protein